MEVSNTSKTIKGISSQAIVTLVLGVFDVLSFSIMSRLLTQEDFGYYAAISAITLIFASLSEAGIGSAIIQRKDLDQRFVNNAFTLCLTCGLLFGGLLLIFSGFLAETFIDDSMKVPIQIMAITLLFNSLTSAYRSIMQRNLDFFKIGLINLVSLIITSIVAIVLAVYGLGYYAIIAKALLASFISIVLFAIFSRCRFRISWDGRIIKEIFSFSGWLTAAGIFNNLAQQVDRLLMTKFLGVDILGAYNRPKEFISQISSKINSIFDSALFPVLSSIQDDNEALFRSYLKSLYGLNLFSSVLALAFIVNSELIIRVFFGESWLNLTHVFQLLSIVLLVNVDARLEDCYLRSLGLTKSQFFFRLAEFFFNVIGIIIGTKWGIIGVSIAMLIVNFISVFIKLLYIDCKLHVNHWKVIAVIGKGWLSILYVYPVCVALKSILPCTLLGNVILFFAFILLYVFLLLIVPSLLGKQYKSEVLCLLLSFVKRVR